MFEQFEMPAVDPWVHLFWAAPLLLVVTAWSMARRRHTLSIFGYDAVRSRAWIQSLGRRRWRRAVLFSLAIVFFTVAAVRPRCNPESETYKTASRDIAVLLDVSRSMLANDLQPSRLERAKDELMRLADHLHGDRVGLVVFAGDAVIKCPLTRNYSYFKSIVRHIATTSASQGGTRIGDAVRKALADLLGFHSSGPTLEAMGPKVGETVMADEMRGEKTSYADILLITDGEDHKSYPVKAAQQATGLNVGIYTVGLGSEEGSTIPIQGRDGQIEFLKDRDGRLVKSTLDSKTLLEMTNMAPRGAYLPVGTQNFDLRDFYDRTIAQDARRDVFEKRVFWTEIFQPFLLAGLFFYLLHLAVLERPKTGQLAIETAQE